MNDSVWMLSLQDSSNCLELRIGEDKVVHNFTPYDASACKKLQQNDRFCTVSLNLFTVVLSLMTTFNAQSKF